jgi:phosphoglycolate phosphatase-like HAD superfamily hydrolase
MALFAGQDGIRCIAFDFDGTLVVSNEIKLSALYSVVKDIPGAGQCLDEIMARPTHGDRTDIYRALDRLLRDRRLWRSGDPDRWVVEYTDACEYQIIRAPEVPGAVHILEQLLSQNIPCYLNSSTPADPLRRIVAGRAWARFFRHILGWSGDKAGNLREIAQAGYKPSEMLMVGDSEEDLDAAARFGCRFVGIGRDASRFVRTPDVVFPDLHALADKLLIPSTGHRPAGAASRGS